MLNLEHDFIISLRTLHNQNGFYNELFVSKLNINEAITKNMTPRASKNK